MKFDIAWFGTMVPLILISISGGAVAGPLTFDLICHEGSNPESTLSEFDFNDANDEINSSTRLHIRINLGAKKWCMDNCGEIYRLTYDENELTLRYQKISTGPNTGTIEYIRINRRTGFYERDLVDLGNGAARSPTVETYICRRAKFTGFRAAQF